MPETIPIKHRKLAWDECEGTKYRTWVSDSIVGKVYMVSKPTRRYNDPRYYIYIKGKKLSSYGCDFSSASITAQAWLNELMERYTESE